MSDDEKRAVAPASPAHDAAEHTTANPVVGGSVTEGTDAGTRDAAVALPDDEKADLVPEVEEAIDVFKPLPPIAGIAEEGDPLTIRAVLVGMILGSLVNASNVYLGLKTGFTFGASMFGAIFGFGVVKLFTKIFNGVPIIGIPFGPQENSIIQAAAAGSGGMAGVCGPFALISTSRDTPC